ncbi:MAG: hypothetical protein HKO02_10750 [Hyphomonadaceae bacterium]|nr:hypothetical protein [Hyphomonadaceae bacterium]
MSKNKKTILGTCACKASDFELSQMPTQRMYCHCSICQLVYDGPYSDFMLANAKTVSVNPVSKIHYNRYKKPLALDRGVCTECQKPAMGFLQIVPGVRLAFIPAYTLNGHKDIPEPSRHIWYHSRAADIEDDLPKIEGKMRSNMACLGPFYKGFRGKL